MSKINCFYITLLIVLMANVKVLGQSHSVLRGRVVNEDRLPIAGVKISSGSDPTKQVQSDRSGVFSIRTNLPDSIMFSHVSYSPKSWYVTKNSETLEVMLLINENQLGEVEINTGYQVLRPNEISGSIQVLGKDKLNEQMGTNILDRLRNVSAGLLFDQVNVGNKDLQKLNFTVRGLSTINGSIDPLIVLDGFIYEGNIDNIDPGSIESISILKDAAATSIWGARAGNGVVVINSVKGTHRQNGLISLEQSLLISQKSDYKNLYEMSAADFIDVEDMLFKNGYYNNQITRNPERAMTPMMAILNKSRNGEIGTVDSLRMVNKLLNNSSINNYRNHFLNTPILSQTFFNVANTSKAVRYNLGIGYTSNQGEQKDVLKKLNLYWNNSVNIAPGLTVDVNLKYTSQRSKSGTPSLSSLSYSGKSVPYMDFLDESQQPARLDLTYSSEFMDQYYPGKLLSWNYIPLEDYKHSVSTTDLTEWYALANAKYQVFDFLDFTSGLQIQSQQNRNTTQHDPESYYARVLINQFTEINSASNSVKYNIPIGGIKKDDVVSGSSYTWRNQFNLAKVWTDFDLKAIFGSELRQNKIEGNSMQVYGYDSDPLRTSPVDYSKTFPTLPLGANYSITGYPSYSETLNRFVSLYINSSLIYKKRYGINGSVRRDGANIFGAKTNDQWSPFWSAGLFWDVSKEGFFKFDYLELFKLRATYGYSGNVDLRKTPLPIASSSTASLTNFPTLIINSLNDPTLRWEKVRTFNMGLDFRLKGGAVSGALEFYEKNGRDLYGVAAYDYTVYGRSSTLNKNVGEMVGRGIETRLSILSLRNKHMELQTDILFNTNKNKTTAYYQQNFTGLISFVGAGGSVVPIVGRPLNAVVAWKWAGLDENGNPQGYLNDERSIDYLKIRAEASDLNEKATNLEFLGSSVPQVFGSIANTFRFRKFSLAVNLSYKADYYFMRPVTSYANLYISGKAQRDFEERWQSSGDENTTHVPSLNYPLNRERDAFYAASDINALRGDHVRLEYINIGWSTQVNRERRPLNIYMKLNLSNLGVIWRSNQFVKDPQYPESIMPGKRIGISLKVEL
ncbi:TonB-dependent receptor plug domain-containing protein [Sphingobacterium faecium]|uniref:TonB-dependent receptor plug domain-containing protein n=1 Tax=Sphingobacterium faecium TaxID=34087 RepID=UPI001290EB15|nr:TonB-dependent receptor plug domain-containing protein [Sphingobacterium faecium]MQP29561.1 TonB-dependent receptor plug domain-containing protein [Sphingobacterium faecium]